MTPEEHKMLVETREATLQNTQILLQMQRANRVALGMRILYWLIIIGLSVGALYFIQPYIDALKDVTGNITGF